VLDAGLTSLLSKRNNVVNEGCGSKRAVLQIRQKMIMIINDREIRIGKVRLFSVKEMHISFDETLFSCSEIVMGDTLQIR
jgi:hypothetical protein